MKRLNLLYCLLIAVSLPVYSQTLHPYAYQNPLPVPQVFAPGIISTVDGAEFASAFSPDGKEVYFVVRTLLEDPRMTIYVSCFRNGNWSKPEKASFSGKFDDIDPMFSPDGKRLYFNSKRPERGSTGSKYHDLFYVERTPQGWSEPVRLPAPINLPNSSEIYPCQTRDGTLYFASDRIGGFGKMDIYRARLVDGKYQAPENIGAFVNSTDSESNAYVSPDERYMIYYSTNKDGFGFTDLYISYFEKGVWNTPENLGELINTEAEEYAPVVSPDGKYLFFSRGRVTDIYQVDLDVLNLKK